MQNAKQLPEFPAQGAGEVTGLQYLTFLVSGETFGCGINQIKEIIEYGSITQVPMMPGFIRGVINLRGKVVPVIDLAVQFGGTASLGRRTCIVIIELEREAGRQDVGILVDAVCEVLDIPSSEIESPPRVGAGLRTDFIRGMGKVDDGFVILLDMKNLVGADVTAQLADMDGAAPITKAGATKES